MSGTFTFSCRSSSSCGPVLFRPPLSLLSKAWKSNFEPCSYAERSSGAKRPPRAASHLVLDQCNATHRQASEVAKESRSTFEFIEFFRSKCSVSPTLQHGYPVVLLDLSATLISKAVNTGSEPSLPQVGKHRTAGPKSNTLASYSGRSSRFSSSINKQLIVGLSQNALRIGFSRRAR